MTLPRRWDASYERWTVGSPWYVMPEEGGGTLADNDRINAIAACGENVNIMYAGGLGANATDGFLVKAA